MVATGAITIECEECTLMVLGKRINGMAPATVAIDDVDLGSYDFWAKDDQFRDGAFATLRREAPVSFQREPEVPGFVAGPGHWAFTLFEDVTYINRTTTLFSSEPNTLIIDLPAEMLDTIGNSMLTMDDPRHSRLRSIVQRAFTPKVIARTTDQIRRIAQELVDAMLDKHADNTCDFVGEFAGRLPLAVICDLMGIPTADRDYIYHLTNVIQSFGDPDVCPTFEIFREAWLNLASYGLDLAKSRTSREQDDLTSSLVRAEVDGEKLTASEVTSFFALLATGGNETTRNALSHGLLALTQYPEQREQLWKDFDAYGKSAAEEIVRWSTPVIYMRRTVTSDTEVRGAKLHAGEKVTIWYNSANRDESVFADPWKFAINRTPNPQVGYGGGGAHFCLGANLARTEIHVALDELRRRLPDLNAVDEPDVLLSPYIHGIKRLKVEW